MADRIPYPLELMTERLTLRSPSPEDAAQMCEAVAESIEDLRPWMPWADSVPTLDKARENCARAAEAFRAQRDYRIHAFLRSSGQFVGSCGLHRADWSVPKFEIGYWVRRSLMGRGYATEIVRGLARFAFEELGAARVEIRMSDRNVRSRRVAERAGFELEGILRNDERHLDGSLRDSRVYALVRQVD
jgi:RimJ/RimL family protein N-acetyltransferase